MTTTVRPGWRRPLDARLRRPACRPRNLTRVGIDALVIVASAVGALVTYASVAERRPVLAAREVPRGRTVTAADLRVARVSATPPSIRCRRPSGRRCSGGGRRSGWCRGRC